MSFEMSLHDLNQMTVSHPFRGNSTSGDTFSAYKYNNILYVRSSKVSTYLKLSMNCRVTIDEFRHYVSHNWLSSQLFTKCWLAFNPWFPIEHYKFFYPRDNNTVMKDICSQPVTNTSLTMSLSRPPLRFPLTNFLAAIQCHYQLVLSTRRYYQSSAKQSN